MRVYYHTIDLGVAIGSLVCLEEPRQVPYGMEGEMRDEYRVRLADGRRWVQGVVTEIPNDQPYIEMVYRSAVRPEAARQPDSQANEDSRIRERLLRSVMRRQDNSVLGTAIIETNADGLTAVQLGQSIANRAIDSLNELLDRVQEIQESRPGLVDAINRQPPSGTSMGHSIAEAADLLGEAIVPPEAMVSGTDRYTVNGLSGVDWDTIVGIPETPGFNMTEQQRERLREMVRQTFGEEQQAQETEAQRIFRIREEISERPLEHSCTLHTNPTEDGFYLVLDRDCKWHYRAHLIDGRLYFNDSSVSLRNGGEYLAYGPIRRRFAPEASTTRILEL